jgi:hypothetical protein
VNDEQKPSAGDEKPEVERPTAEQPTTEQPAEEAVQWAPPAPPAPDVSTTSEQPAAPKSSSTSRTRNTLMAGGAGLALAGGLVGFGIGHASADNGDRFTPTSQYVPGNGQQNFRDGEGQRPDGPPGGFGDRDQSGDGGTDDQQSNGNSDPT